MVSVTRLVTWRGILGLKGKGLSGLKNANAKRRVFWTQRTWTQALARGKSLNRKKTIAMRFLNASVLERKSLNRNLSWGFPLGNLLPKTRVLKHRVLERKRRPNANASVLGTQRFRTLRQGFWCCFLGRSPGGLSGASWCELWPWLSRHCSQWPLLWGGTGRRNERRACLEQANRCNGKEEKHCCRCGTLGAATVCHGRQCAGSRNSWLCRSALEPILLRSTDSTPTTCLRTRRKIKWQQE